ncbi:carboxypeptidase regulatory-like domain-containing protein [Faecalibacter bovis]|uniref:Carboxypeptidase regulatory-like domain-containing protein n=1 Tax=Faecalibacter bovis TaxID=2898187 RepID=A0ABX7XBK2_9FLAO|nr:carboxypeptidase regulatory-like domain-containing protein [Faecalibacter bovis]QTV05291.1 carboxypeptidase regulatory-like domain-containing protein [Faecalibacter bovis]
MKNIISKYFFLLNVFLFSLSFIQCSEDYVDGSEKGTIKGIVVKHQSNEPLANVKITTAPTTETVFTSEDGSFIIKNVPLGDYSVKAELRGYLMEIQGANLVDYGQEVGLVFEMKDDNSLNSPPSVPQLLTPADNASELGLNVEVSWNCTDADSDELTYKLILKNNKNDEVLTYENITEKFFTFENLTFGTSYFWQVIASDGINDEVYSNTFKFTTSSIPQNRFHYVKLEGNNHVIYSSDETGNNFKFTQESVNSLRPRKNNSASLVSFLRMVEGNMHLFTAKLDGSDSFRVTEIPLAGFNNNEIDYAWSANGSEFLYPNYNKLYRVNKDGSGTNLVYTTDDGNFITECAWSYDGSKIVLKTNNIEGYNVKIYMIDLMGNKIKTILENVNGAAGGLDISVDGSKILFTRDISGFQNQFYRQLNTHIFIYDLNSDNVEDISDLSNIPSGFIDIDPRFSPNEAEVIFTQTSNDGRSQKDIYKVSLNADNDGRLTRTLLFENAWMPDWE